MHWHYPGLPVVKIAAPASLLVPRIPPAPDTPAASQIHASHWLRRSDTHWLSRQIEVGRGYSPPTRLTPPDVGVAPAPDGLGVASRVDDQASLTSHISWSATSSSTTGGRRTLTEYPIIRHGCGDAHVLKHMRGALIIMTRCGCGGRAARQGHPRGPYPRRGPGMAIHGTVGPFGVSGVGSCGTWASPGSGAMGNVRGR